jgi:uncharacterized protein YbjT (DUF2867 family)
MRILVTGASGYVGPALIPRLLGEGNEVRALAREPQRARDAVAFEQGAPTLRSWATVDEPEVLTGDTLTGDGLAKALDGVDVAYYLIHSMESIDRRAAAGDTWIPSGFAERERRSAENFAAATREAQVARIVYLGGLLPEHGPASAHLESRLAVERILLEAIPGSVALRSSIVIGARSRSLRLMVKLLERLPVLMLPAWHSSRTTPIDGRDIVELLLASAQAPQVAGRSLDVGGPEALTYGEMLTRVAELMLVGRSTLKLGFSLTPIAARVAAALTSEDPALILPLMEGLECDLLPSRESAVELLGIELHSFDAAVEHALREWERVEPLPAR